MAAAIAAPVKFPGKFRGAYRSAQGKEKVSLDDDTFFIRGPGPPATGRQACYVGTCFARPRQLGARSRPSTISA